jgi:hypothetical protein
MEWFFQKREAGEGGEQDPHEKKPGFAIEAGLTSSVQKPLGTVKMRTRKKDTFACNIPCFARSVNILCVDWRKNIAREQFWLKYQFPKPEVSPFRPHSVVLLFASGTTILHGQALFARATPKS